MKKYWLEIILILVIIAVICLTCSDSSADEFDSPYIINCLEHGELMTENEVMTLIVLGREIHLCMFCAGRFWENNKAEVNRMIAVFESHE